MYSLNKEEIGMLEVLLNKEAQWEALLKLEDIIKTLTNLGRGITVEIWSCLTITANTGTLIALLGDLANLILEITTPDAIGLDPTMTMITFMVTIKLCLDLLITTTIKEASTGIATTIT